MDEVKTAPPENVRLSPKIVWGVLAVMFLLALCYPLINIGLKDSPPMTFAAMRAALAGVALLLIAQYQRRPTIKEKGLWASVIVIGVFATSVGFFGMFYGGARVSPGLATVISNTQPLIAAILAWWALDDRLQPKQRWGLLAGFCGVVLIGLPTLSGNESQTIGIAAILFAALGIAISNIVLCRLAGRIDVLRATGWQLLIGSVPLGLLAASTEDVYSITWSASFTVVLLTLSLLGTAAPFVWWFALLQHARLNQLNAFTFITPILALIMGMLFFAETIPAIAVIGIGLSLVGIYWVNGVSPAADVIKNTVSDQTRERQSRAS